MPRCARVKALDSVFHVMCRSISEVALFKSDEDKIKYLSIIKDYQNFHKFRVYGYCLMTNHGHMIIDANGADISTIMHGINFKYAMYYNHKYNRRGHLFQDRFKSKIVKDDRYLYTLSAYVHNNVTDIAEFKDKPEEYLYSSLGVYLGIRQDRFELVEDSFVLSMFARKPREARKAYRLFMGECKELISEEEAEFVNDKTEYRSGRKILTRNMSPTDIVDYIVKKMETSRAMICTKYNRNMISVKAILCVALRCMCNAKCNDICKILGNITESTVSKYCGIGIQLINKDEKYRDIIEGLII